MGSLLDRRATSSPTPKERGEGILLLLFLLVARNGLPCADHLAGGVHDLEGHALGVVGQVVLELRALVDPRAPRTGSVGS